MSLFSLEANGLLVLVFFLLVGQKIVNTLGKSQFHDWAWSGYSKVSRDEKLVLVNGKSQELANVIKERKSISAQDEYARWTKLNRRSDKLTNELKELEGELSQMKSQVNNIVNLVILFGSTLPLYFVRFWYRKAILFYLPVGVFPYYVEYILALPFTRIGAIGLTVYMFAINSVLSNLFFLVSFPFTEKIQEPEPQLKNEVSAENI